MLAQVHHVRPSSGWVQAVLYPISVNVQRSVSPDRPQRLETDRWSDELERRVGTKYRISAALA